MQQQANNHPAINFTYHIIMVFAICTIITLILPFLNFFFIKKIVHVCRGNFIPSKDVLLGCMQYKLLFGCWKFSTKLFPKKLQFFLVSKVVALATASGSSIKTKMGTPQYFFTLRMKVNYSKSTCGTFATSLQFV